MSNKTIPADLRRLIAERGRYSCEYCKTQARYSPDSLTIDHVKPISLNGSTSADNLALCCYACNQHKAARTKAPDPVTGSLAPLFHPRTQAWDEHFTWSEDFTLILGLTQTGRATIDALHLNRVGLVNARRVLHAIGEHPSDSDPEF